MTYNPDIHHRRSIRLQNFDYASAGAYFVTICTQLRECLFGEVVDDVMVANDAGRMVESVWYGLPERFSGIELDAFVILPNHVHFILFLVGAPLAFLLHLPANLLL
jgi:putative transposase